MTKENTWLPLSVPDLFISLKFSTAQQTAKERGIVRGEQNQERYYYFLLYLFIKGLFWKNKDTENIRQWKTNLHFISCFSFLKVSYSLNGKESLISIKKCFKVRVQGVVQNRINSGFPMNFNIYRDGFLTYSENLNKCFFMFFHVFHCWGWGPNSARTREEHYQGDITECETLSFWFTKPAKDQ